MIMVHLQALLLARLRDRLASEKDSKTMSNLGCSEMTCFHDDFFRHNMSICFYFSAKLVDISSRL